MKKNLLAIFFLMIGLANVNAQNVFFIGDDDSAYEKEMGGCPEMLLSVVGNDMQKAATLWSDVLVAIQNKAAKEEFPLNGVKIWANIFFKKDGSVKMLGFYPKPTSKNMDFDKLKGFLESFAKEYKLPKTHKTCFSHYGSASFPLGVR